VILNTEGARIHVAYYMGNFDTDTDETIVVTVMLRRREGSGS
jgi:hypothetical protein